MCGSVILSAQVVAFVKRCVMCFLFLKKVKQLTTYKVFVPIETRDLVVGVKGGSIALQILSLLQLQAAVFS